MASGIRNGTAARTSRNTAPRGAHLRIVAPLALLPAVLAAGCTTGSSIAYETCDDILPEILELSQEDAVASILDVYDISTVSDDIDAYESGDIDLPQGSEQVRLLVCQGDAALSNGESIRVEFDLRVDSKDELFLYYQVAE